ncbi:dihydroorotate dehydrogenase electron transfer subunit [Berryella wangjianweii]|nr:dihydroorotate dehydrogenase electron transfer subunit [Berryella wangjianweii]
MNEHARLLANERLSERLCLMEVEAPICARGIEPGQFVHMRFPDMGAHLLRRPFSVYTADREAGTMTVLYQLVGEGTAFMAELRPAASPTVEAIGPVGRAWSAAVLPSADEGGRKSFLLVGGGVGAAPLHLLAERLVSRGHAVDVVLGAQTASALVTRERYEALLGRAPFCATDDGTFGARGFCTGLVSERLDAGCSVDGSPYAQVCVCGPEPLMRIVADRARATSVPCEVSLERRMACGVGACLSCVVDTPAGKRRACVDGPVFDAQEVIW